MRYRLDPKRTSFEKMPRFLLAMMVVIGVACAIPRPQTVGHTELEIRRLEQAIENAVTQGNIEFLQEVIADDFHFKHGTGQIDNKISWLNFIRSKTFTSRKITTAEIEIHGDIALTAGTIFVTRKPQLYETGEQHYSVTYVRLYRLAAGAWRLVSHRTTAGG